MRALVTGATGFVGQRLLAKLQRPVVLSRDATQGAKKLAKFGANVYAWDAQGGSPPADALDGVDAVIHLAGESVAEGRWTAAKKARIRESRVAGTRNLVAGLRKLSDKPKVLVSASAVGIYGTRAGEELTEASPPGNDFLAGVCSDWEREALAARELGIRVVPIRIGIVLGERGGALSKMLTPFKVGLGSPLGSGNQYMPWVHIDDLVELILFAARDPAIATPLNGVSPHPVTNREFTKTLGRVLGRPTFFPPVPGFMLRLMLGEFAGVLLGSQRVLPQAALSAGFTFKFPELEPALRDVLHSSQPLTAPPKNPAASSPPA
jgi:uncharacterized protein (TIGR01777 family)